MRLARVVAAVLSFAFLVSFAASIACIEEAARAGWWLGVVIGGAFALAALAMLVFFALEAFGPRWLRPR